jgi:major vault protein
MNYNNGDWANISQISQSNRQRDLVLAVNEFAFIMAKTNGAIKTYTGPITMTISAQESLVVFNPKTKKFEETQDFEKAKQLFVSAPEGWYIVLKNPSADNAHPEPTKAVNSAPLNIGRKINIAGPASFSLFPGQMARVIRGHRLRSNQYLLARVYDAEAARKGISTATKPEPLPIIFSTSARASFRFTPIDFNVLAATPVPSPIRPNKTCSVPTKL